MKKIIQSTIAIIAVIFSLNVSAQSVKNENSLLWEISGNGLKQSSYLYGTFHLMCESDFQMKEKVKKSFDKTEKIVLELDFDNPEELKSMQEYALSKEPLSKKLSKEEYEKLDAILKKEIGQSASAFENTNLVSIMSTLMFKAINCTPKMYEMEFLSMAMSKKMNIEGLETFNAQIESFNKSFTNSEFINSLSLYTNESMANMIKVYNSENVVELEKLLNDERFMGKNGTKYLLDERNQNWVKKIPEMIEKESAFIAVGAAHLLGEQGVINLLQKQGYTVKPIFN